VRAFGPPYPTHDWNATITIADLCSRDDPRGMLAWAALSYDPARGGFTDLEDELSGLFVEIYARLPYITGELPADAVQIERLCRDTARVQAIVSGATAPRLAHRSA
jgi:hypothetical protein